MEVYRTIICLLIRYDIRQSNQLERDELKLGNLSWKGARIGPISIPGSILIWKHRWFGSVSCDWRWASSSFFCFLSRLSEVLARFSLSPEFIWQALNNAVIFLSVLFFANATLVWVLMLFTSSADSITGWALRIALLTLLDIGCASSSLQLGKVHFARKIEKQVTGALPKTSKKLWFSIVFSQSGSSQAYDSFIRYH